MPLASETCVNRFKEPNQFVSPLADGWHAFQGAVYWGADRPGVSLRSTPRLISLNPQGSRLRHHDLRRTREDPLQLV